MMSVLSSPTDSPSPRWSVPSSHTSDTRRKALRGTVHDIRESSDLVDTEIRDQFGSLGATVSTG